MWQMQDSLVLHLNRVFVEQHGGLRCGYFHHTLLLGLYKVVRNAYKQGKLLLKDQAMDSMRIWRDLLWIRLFLDKPVPEELLSFMGVMYPSSSVSPLDALSPRKMVGSALYLWPPLSSVPAWLRLFLCRVPLQRWSSRAGMGPPVASWFTPAWAPAIELSEGFGPPSR